MIYPHHFFVLIVTIYRTFVLLKPLICPVGASFLPALFDVLPAFFEVQSAPKRLTSKAF
jgi:hypothetical protein